MRRIIVVGGILILLASLSLTLEADIPFLSVLNRVVTTLLEKLWELLLQPVVLVALSLFLFLKYGASYLGAIIPFLRKFGASIGPLSLEESFDFSQVLLEPAGDDREGAHRA